MNSWDENGDTHSCFLANAVVKKLVCNRNKPQIATITSDNKVSIIDCHELKVRKSSLL